jgi:hypothetical protein
MAALTAGVSGCFLRQAYVCSLPDPETCEDTASNSWWMDLAEEPVLLEVKPAPAEWQTSTDRQFQVAEWAALVRVQDGEQLLAACTYSDFREVACKARAGSEILDSGVLG